MKKFVLITLAFLANATAAHAGTCLQYDRAKALNDASFKLKDKQKYCACTASKISSSTVIDAATKARLAASYSEKTTDALGVDSAALQQAATKDPKGALVAQHAALEDIFFSCYSEQ